MRSQEVAVELAADNREQLLRALARERTRAGTQGATGGVHRLSRAARSLHEDRYEENPQWERLHRAFHFALLQGCGSDLLLGFCEQLYDQAYRYRQLAALSAYKQRGELDEHRAIFDAVMARR